MPGSKFLFCALGLGYLPSESPGHASENFRYLDFSRHGHHVGHLAGAQFAKRASLAMEENFDRAFVESQLAPHFRFETLALGSRQKPGQLRVCRPAGGIIVRPQLSEHLHRAA